MTSAEGRRFGRHVVKVELQTLLSNPLRRPLGWALLIGAIPTAIMIWTFLPAHPVALTGAIAYLVALLLIGLVYALVAPGIEARAFDAAPHRWFVRIAGGQAGAFARPDRRGRLTVYSVWADPRGQGIGTRIMRHVIDDTASAGDLWLVAVNKKSAAFYSRLGFRHVRQELLGHRMVLERQPQDPTRG